LSCVLLLVVIASHPFLTSLPAGAHAFFKEPEVLRGDQVPQLKWSAPDEEALVAFLVGEWQQGLGRWLRCGALG
jgi:hypothetical protein